MARNRRKTIESLKRLAERPGTPAEGETARRLLEQFGVAPEAPRLPFDASLLVPGTRVYYNYWAYPMNCAGTITAQAKPKFIEQRTWIRIKFDHLKSSREVPITSQKGFHLSRHPVSAEMHEHLYLNWDMEVWNGGEVYA